MCPPYPKRRKTDEKTGYMPDASIYKTFDSGHEKSPINHFYSIAILCEGSNTGNPIKPRTVGHSGNFALFSLASFPERSNKKRVKKRSSKRSE